MTYYMIESMRIVNYHGGGGGICMHVINITPIGNIGTLGASLET